MGLPDLLLQELLSYFKWIGGGNDFEMEEGEGRKCQEGGVRDLIDTVLLSNGWAI